MHNLAALGLEPLAAILVVLAEVDAETPTGTRRRLGQSLEKPLAIWLGGTLWFGETGERLEAEILDLEQRTDLPPGAIGNDQGARPGQSLQTGAEVWRLADDVPLLRSAGADQIANDDEAGGDADPHVQRLLCGEPDDFVDDRQPGADSASAGATTKRLWPFGGTSKRGSRLPTARPSPKRERGTPED